MNRHELLREWSKILTKTHRCTVSQAAKGFTVAGGQDLITFEDESSAFVAFDPDSQNEWGNRVKVVEQLAAKYLLSRPYSFALEVNEPESRDAAGPAARVLRCAFRISLYHTSMYHWRMTAYDFIPWGACSVIEGSDSLFSRPDLDLTPISATIDVELRQSLGRVSDAISRKAKEFVADGGARGVLNEAGRRLRSEIRALRSLYREEPRCKGFQSQEANASQGAFTVKQEFHRRIAGVMKRSTVVVLADVISIGVLHCRCEKQGKEVSCPFLCRPLVVETASGS